MATIISRDELVSIIFDALRGMPIDLERHPDGHGGVRAGITSHVTSALEAAHVVVITD